MNPWISALLLTSLVLSGCSVAFTGLPSGKAGLTVGLGSPSRAISDQMDSLTLQGPGPDGAQFAEQSITSGASVFALDPGKWTFTVKVFDASGEVLQEDTREAELIAGETTQLSFTVHTRGTISGRLVNATGAALAGATLWVADLDTLPATVATRTLTTDADGRFEASDLPRGRLQVFLMDLAAGSSAPSADYWWQPWVVESTQTGAVVLAERGPVETFLHIWTKDPDLVAIPEIPMALVAVETDQTAEFAWSTTHNARVYLFTQPDTSAGTTYVFRSFHDRYDFGTEVNSRISETFWMRRDTEGWVTLRASDPTTNLIENAAYIEGAAAEVVVRLKKFGGIDDLDSAVWQEHVMSFAVSGPGISDFAILTNETPSTVDLTLTNGLPGIYTFVPQSTNGTSDYFETFSVTVTKVGELVELEKVALSPIPLP